MYFCPSAIIRDPVHDGGFDYDYDYEDFHNNYDVDGGRRLFSRTKGVCVLWCTTITSMVAGDYSIDEMFDANRWSPGRGECLNHEYESGDRDGTGNMCLSTYDGQTKARDNSCASAYDGTCDDSTGPVAGSSPLCEEGTDVADCSQWCLSQCPEDGVIDERFLCKAWCADHDKVQPDTYAHSHTHANHTLAGASHPRTRTTTHIHQDWSLKCRAATSGFKGCQGCPVCPGICRGWCANTTLASSGVWPALLQAAEPPAPVGGPPAPAPPPWR